MIDRAEVESLLATVEQIHKPNKGVIAELCRVYLACLDAPVAVAGESAGRFYYAGGSEPIEHGKRVRLVTDAEGE